MKWSLNDQALFLLLKEAEMLKEKIHAYLYARNMEETLRTRRDLFRMELDSGSADSAWLSSIQRELAKTEQALACATEDRLLTTKALLSDAQAQALLQTGATSYVANQVLVTAMVELSRKLQTARRYAKELSSVCEHSDFTDITVKWEEAQKETEYHKQLDALTLQFGAEAVVSAYEKAQACA